MLIWWYIHFPRRFFDFFKKFTIFFEDRLGILLTLRFLFVPLYHDYTKLGRVLGFIIRTLWIIGAITVLLTAELILIFLFLAGLILPPLLLFLLLFNLSNLSLWLFTLFLFLLIFLTYRLFSTVPASRLRPLLKISDPNLLFSSILREGQVQDLIRRLGIEPEVFQKEVEKSSPLYFSISAEEIFKKAFDEAQALKSPYLDLNHLFLAFAQLFPVRKILEKLELEPDHVREVVLWQKRIEEWTNPLPLWDPHFVLKRGGGVNRSRVGVITPTLDKYGLDLTKEAQKGRLPRVLGKEKPIEEALRVLSRAEKNSVILTGPPGSGKTILVSGLAQKIIEGGAPLSIQDKRLVKLNPAALEGGTKTKGELEGRLHQVAKEVEASGNVILFIDEIHNLSPPAFSVLEPHLGEARFQLIAACSLESYREFIETHPAFARVLQMVEVPEASFSETVEVLEYVSLEWEREQKVAVSYPALTGAIKLSKRFIHERVLPDKAIDVLDETAVAVGRERPGGIVTFDDVAKIVSERTHVPVQVAGEEESARLLKLEELMHKRLVDQEEAVKAVSDALRRARAGLQKGERPIVSLLFIGPTGVGKTETAKTVAESFFGSEKQMIRFDMSEFQEKSTIERLIDNLCGEVRRRPFSLILLDEFEKAHKDLLNIFLQVLEDARLTDSKGRTVDFAQTIIIATSNAGTTLIQKGLRAGRSITDLREEVFAALQEFFRPELLNRFDGIILFKPLSPEDMVAIARLKMKELEKHLLEKEITLEVSDDLVERLAAEGYDPALGARPLRRLIQDKIESPLAKKILSGEVKKGQALQIDADWLTPSE